MYLSFCKPVLSSPSRGASQESPSLGKLFTSRDGRVYEIHQWPVVNLGPFEGEAAFPLRLEVGGLEIVSITYTCVNEGRPGRTRGTYGGPFSVDSARV